MRDERRTLGAGLKRRLRREPPRVVPPTEEARESEHEISASVGGAEHGGADDAELDALRAELLRELGRLADRSDPGER